MEYKETLISKIKIFSERNQNKNDMESANTLLLELSDNKSGAKYLSQDLQKCRSKSEGFFSKEYIDLIKNYDIGKLMEEGLRFGETLTVVVDVDGLKEHQVQFREGVSRDDFGGINRNKNYKNITILMHYPSDAKIIEYISRRLNDEFRNAKVIFEPR
jgi:hypothetical protein